MTTVSAAYASGQLRAVFKVPTVTCNSASSGIFIGVIIESTISVLDSGVAISCSASIPSYATEIELGTYQPINDAVSAGDTIKVTLLSHNNRLTAYYKDLTTGVSLSSMIGNAIGTNASFIAGVTTIGSISKPNSGTQLPVADFTNVKLYDAQFDDMTAAAADAVPVGLVNHSNVEQVSTGPLNSTGSGWYEYFKHS